MRRLRDGAIGLGGRGYVNCQVAPVLRRNGCSRRWNVRPARREEEVSVRVEDGRKRRCVVVGWKELG